MNKRTDAATVSLRVKTACYILFMFGAIAATIMITELLRHYLNFALHNLVLIYVLSVFLISCLTPGYLYGCAAAIISALACDFLIVTPRLGFSFTVGSPVTLATLLTITLITSTLVSRLRTQQTLAVTSQRHFEFLYEINRELLSARSIDAIVRLVNRSLHEHVERPVIFYTADPAGTADTCCRMIPENEEARRLFLCSSEFLKLHKIFSGDDNGSNLTNAACEPVYYVPLLSNANVTGVIGIYCGGDPLRQDNLYYVNTLAGQVALALELQILSDRQEKLMLDAEKEKVRSTLLRSLSHDFRTPVTTIRGSSEVMLEYPDMPRETRRKLLRDIIEYADWLIRMVENILMITRISDKSLQLNKQAEAAEEIVAAAITIVRKRYPDSPIVVRAPDDLLFIPMDATLIAQVLVNLVENAIKHSASMSPITIRLYDEDETVVFEVSDSGIGIAPERFDHLFTPFTPDKLNADISKGAGIGLSICQTIVNAHGGSISGKNRKEGGAVFTFALPKENTEYEI